MYGGVIERAAADFVVIEPATSNRIFHTPEGLSDEVASTLPVAAATAAAVLAALDPSSADTVLVAGSGRRRRFRRAAGSARWRGGDRNGVGGHVRVPTRSRGATGHLGPGLEDRVRACAPGGVTAAIDLFGTETIETALALGVAPDRIVAIAAGPNPPGGARAVVGGDAQPDAIPQVAAAIVAKQVTVPIAARFPIEQISEAAALQADRHVHGKIVVTL